MDCLFSLIHAPFLIQAFFRGCRWVRRRWSQLDFSHCHQNRQALKTTEYRLKVFEKAVLEIFSSLYYRHSTLTRRYLRCSCPFLQNCLVAGDFRRLATGWYRGRRLFFVAIRIHARLSAFSDCSLLSVAMTRCLQYFLRQLSFVWSVDQFRLVFLQASGCHFLCHL